MTVPLRSLLLSAFVLVLLLPRPASSQALSTTVPLRANCATLTGAVANTSLCKDTTRGILAGYDGTGWQSDVALATRYVNVKDPRWGAKGDGTTDDTTAINNAIDSLDSTLGGVVFFPPGNYLTTDQIHVNGKNFITLQGSGQAIDAPGSTPATRITKTGAVANPVIKGTNARRLAIRDLTLDHGGTAVAGQHGIQLVASGAGAYRVNVTMNRVSIYNTYDGIRLEDDCLICSLTNLFIRNVINDGIVSTSSIIGSRLSTIYVSAPGRHGLNMFASASRFDTIITEVTGGHGITGTYNRSSFANLYLGDSVGQNAIRWLNSNNNTVTSGNITAGTSHSLLYLDSSTANTFSGLDMQGGGRYIVETANTSGLDAGVLIPNSVQWTSGTGGATLGFTNDTTATISMERSPLSPDAGLFTTQTFASQATADRWSWKARTPPDASVAAHSMPGANPDPDALERWSFFSRLPGGAQQITTFPLVGRNATNSILTLPSTETLGAALITGDASTFAAGIGAWVATGGTFVATGGLGVFTSTVAANPANIELAVAGLNTAKLYKLTFNLNVVSPFGGAIRPSVRNAANTDYLVRSAAGGTTTSLSSTQIMYFIPDGATIPIQISDNNPSIGDVFRVDNFDLREVQSAAVLQFSGGRKTGTTAGGGGSITLYGNEHATNPGQVAVVGTMTLGTALGATYGGTGQASYAIGDLLAADTTTTLSRITAVAAGHYLRSAGTGTLPAWSVLTLPDAATATRLVYATGTNTWGDSANLTYASGTLTLGGATPLVTLLDSGTSYSYVILGTNANAHRAFLAQEGSAGGTLVTGSTAYGTIVGSHENDVLQFITNSVVRAELGTSGGFFVGAATGGDKGAGTVNAAAAYYSNGTIGIGTVGTGTAITVRKGDDTGTCTITVAGGLVIGTTC